MRLCLAGLLLALAVACTSRDTAPLDLKGTDISGADFGGSFALTAHTGKKVALSDFKGKVVALFFGYTHCPDVCPTTMLEYAGAMKKLGERARDVQVLFVSVDPARDTPAVLAGYVPGFDARFIGLTGSEAEVRRVAEQFKVVAQKVPAEGGGYTMDHSAGSYLFDREGQLRVYEAYGAGSANLAHDLDQLLR
ncbi:Cytochrome oxidase Cu insertion factor, SCO1/SenC/PrrC family [Gulbenkiania indica]|uniref:Cytochrome oxidase Cu insertion factor, SCO1/SenC/PrrC family n=3 Tax=Chromobacteriaceae TaxID=1499392 RepID=A0A0K6GT75_9NEIS|nr:protein SCO1/2 [Gulbenkiania mobilis]CUA81959.1 Cytochrome oxidase Cu insertion factor, SCO1/SenC/PrrC family [Gulbenkiania indica]